MTYKQIAEILGTTDKYIKKVVYVSKHPKPRAPQRPGTKVNYDPDSEVTKRERQRAQVEILSHAAEDGLLPVSPNKANIMKAVGKIGDDKVGAFISYHVEMLKMRQGVDKKNVPDLYRRFLTYLEYCAAHNIMPGNMSAYFAIGIDEVEINSWRRGVRGTPEHKQFAEDVASFFRSVHEQAPTEGLMNPISAMFWQKAHDGMIEASKVEQVQADPLGDKQSAEDIIQKYEGVELPE